MRQPRSVPVSHALDWYSEALRLWKRGPVMFTLLAFVVFALTMTLGMVPYAGTVLTQVIVPLAGCALQYASLAADRGDRPRWMHAIAVFSAPPRAMLSVILADAVVFAVQAVVAQLTMGVDLLLPGASALEDLSVGARFVLYVVGVLASLPVMFVPFAALFDLADMRTAFRESAAGFVRNPGALLLFGALSLVLVFLGFATFGIGLLLVLPWVTAASYAAWKDVFAVG